MTRLASVLSLVLLLCATSGQGSAQVSAVNSDVPDCISLAPGGTFAGNPIGFYTVFVADVGGIPVGGAQVDVVFTAGAIPLIAWCGGLPPAGPITGFTGPGGLVTLAMPLGGGCLDGSQPCAVPAAIVTVTGPGGAGMFVENIDCVNSPDAVNSSGLPPACPATSVCAPSPLGGFVTEAGLADAVFHTFPISFGLIEPCSNFSAPFNDPVGLFDAVVLTPFIQNGTFCPC